SYVEFGGTGHVGKIQARSPGGTARSINGRNIVVDLRVAIERKPVAHEWKAIGEVERAKTCAGIAAAIFDRAIGRRQAKKAFQETVDGNRDMPFASPDHGALE